MIRVHTVREVLHISARTVNYCAQDESYHFMDGSKLRAVVAKYALISWQLVGTEEEN